MIKSGIYQIRNTINNKCYIGSSRCIEKRWRTHKSELKHNKHDNTHLQRAWDKYGKDNFVFEVLEEVPVDKLIEVEQQYLDVIKLMSNFYYNGNYDAVKAGMSGRKHTNESKKRISDALKLTDISATCAKTWITRRINGTIKSHYNTKILSFRNRLTGEIFKGLQSDFINKYNLNRPHVTAIINGDRPSHKNWILI